MSEDTQDTYMSLEDRVKALEERMHTLETQNVARGILGKRPAAPQLTPIQQQAAKAVQQIKAQQDGNNARGIIRRTQGGK